MGIERVFNPGGNCCYVIDDVVEERPYKTAAEVATRFLEGKPQGIVWAFYRHFALSKERAFTRKEVLALSGELFPNVGEIYLQLCDGTPPRGIGFEKTRRGTAVGHYEF